jgi:hypothetical protein
MERIEVNETPSNNKSKAIIEKMRISIDELKDIYQKVNVLPNSFFSRRKKYYI